MLSIAQLLLHPLDLLAVAGVLAHIVAELDGWTVVCGGDFDDDVEWFGLLAV